MVDTRRLITLEKCRKYISGLQNEICGKNEKIRKSKSSLTNDVCLLAATLFLVTSTLRTRNCYVLVT